MQNSISILEPVITYGIISVLTVICIYVVWCFSKGGTSAPKIKVVVQDRAPIPVEIEQNISKDILVSQSLQSQQFIGSCEQSTIPIPSLNGHTVFSIQCEILIEAIRYFFWVIPEESWPESQVTYFIVLHGAIFGLYWFLATVRVPLYLFFIEKNLTLWWKFVYDNSFHLTPPQFRYFFGWNITFYELKELKRRVLSGNPELLNNFDCKLLKWADPDRVKDYFDKTLPDDMLKIIHQQAISDARKIIATSALTYATGRGVYYGILIRFFFYRRLFISLIIFIKIPSF